MSIDISEKFKQLVAFAQSLDIEFSLDMLVTFAMKLAAGRQPSEAFWYVILAQDAAKVASIAGVDVATVEKVIDAKAQQLG